MRAEPVVKIGEELARQIRAHAAEMYPDECCGALLGLEAGGSRDVLDLMPLENRRDDSPRNRFEIGAEDVLLAERRSRENRYVILGWYHSHPDAPAKPSEIDREHAWPWYSYVIVSVETGVAKEMTSWRLTNDRGRFVPEEIEIEEWVRGGRVE